MKLIVQFILSMLCFLNVAFANDVPLYEPDDPFYGVNMEDPYNPDDPQDIYFHYHNDLVNDNFVDWFKNINQIVDLKHRSVDDIYSILSRLPDEVERLSAEAEYVEEMIEYESFYSMAYMLTFYCSNDKTLRHFECIDAMQRLKLDQEKLIKVFKDLKRYPYVDDDRPHLRKMYDLAKGKKIKKKYD